MTIEFEPWPKIARLNRDIVITEKIDGTNAAVLIVPVDKVGEDVSGKIIDFVHGGGVTYAVYAQSRTRFITPDDDNFGFAKWVSENAPALVETLGGGRHFGEWWGSGIQRGYGLPKGEKGFSLFNVARWKHLPYGPQDDRNPQTPVPGLYRVPYLAWFDDDEELNEPLRLESGDVQFALNELRENGSFASGNGFKAEGIVIYHTAARVSFKVTLENDEAPKGPEGHKGDEERR